MEGSINSPAMAPSQYCKKSYVRVSFHVTLTLLLLLMPHAASLEFNYQQLGDTGKVLNISGDVEPREGVLELTKYKEDSVGRVIYYKLLHLWDKSSGKFADFTTHFSFTINAPDKTNPGDGITFFLAHPNFPESQIDGSGIGLASREQLRTQNYAKDFPFVAVEFDTLNNTWDPVHDHVGIDVNALNSTSTTEWFTSMDKRGYDADITFNSASNELSVTVTGYKDNVKIKQGLSSLVNLSDILPEWVQFGFSSATGHTIEEHTLSSWSFKSTLEMEPSKRRLVIGLSVGLGVGVLIVIFGVIFLVRWMLRTRGIEDVSLFGNAMDNDFEKISLPKKFSFQELATATNNFASENKIGQGGFGAVYRGFIRGLNTHVAIKKVSPGSRQGVREYVSEVKIISQLRHRNLVQLFGWCHQHDDLLLIYEFMENGSLDYYLFKGKGLLTWKVRYNIARGLASALAISPNSISSNPIKPKSKFSMALETWLIKVKTALSHSLTKKPSFSSSKPKHVAVLSFEIANVMSKLLHLWQSLSDANVVRLRNDAIALEGVRKLISNDESFLLSLAVAEFADSLRLVADSVSRLSNYCHDPSLRSFHRIFTEFANSGLDPRAWTLTTPKDIETKHRKLQHYVSLTATLHKEIDALTLLESAFKKALLNADNAATEHSSCHKKLSDLQQKIFWQKQEVKNLKERSLWNKNFDGVVLLLARFVFTVLARIKVVFGIGHSSVPFLSRSLSSVYPSDHQNPISSCSFISGPLKSSKLDEENEDLRYGFFESNCKVLKLKGDGDSDTLGASALALHYANLVMVLEKMIKSPQLVGVDARDDLYGMLPSSIRSSLRARLRGVGFLHVMIMCLLENGGMHWAGFWGGWLHWHIT